jgi:hypothetical protein
MNTNESTTDFTQWGLPLDEIEQLGQRLSCFYDRFSASLRTKTRDTSDYGLSYVSGLLRMENGRTMANIGRKTGISPQNM